MPSVSIASLIVIGSPCSGPTASPPRARASSAPAPRRGRGSTSSVTTALTAAVQPLDAIEVEVEQLAARELAGADGGGELERGPRGDAVVDHRGIVGGGLRPGLGLELVAQLVLEDLERGVARQRLDAPRAARGSSASSDRPARHQSTISANVSGSWPGRRLDHRAHPLAALPVGQADHGDVADLGVRVEDVLDLLGADVLALADDDVLQPAGERDVAVGRAGSRGRRCGSGRASSKASALSAASV